jgi:putative membrane protein
MLKLHDLPTLNAILNSTSAVLIVIGYFLIRARRIEAHRRTMLAAFTTSTLFLISYLVYHAQVGSVHFKGSGAIRIVYFTILITHTILAVVVAPMVVVTLFRGLKGRFEKHRKLARITLPVWLYVSVTGVVVYAMLYHL